MRLQATEYQNHVQAYGGPHDCLAPCGIPALRRFNVVAVAGDAGTPGQSCLRKLTLLDDRAPHFAQKKVLPSLRDQMVCERMAPGEVQGLNLRLAALRAALQQRQQATTSPCETS